MNKWYEHCGYKTEEEYKEALLQKIIEVSNIIQEHTARNKFNMVPLGYVPVAPLIKEIPLIDYERVFI